MARKERGRGRLEKLFGWLDRRLSELEAEDEEPLSPARREKEAREMISLLKVYEKLLEMKEVLNERERGAGTGAVSHEEAERRRLEIAQRIERLQGRRQDQKGSGSS